MTSEVVDEFPVTNKAKKGSMGDASSASMSPWQNAGDFFHRLFSGSGSTSPGSANPLGNVDIYGDQTGPQRAYQLQAGAPNGVPGGPQVMAGQAPPLPPQAPPAPPLQADPVTGAEPLIPEQPQLPPPQNPGPQDNQSPQAPNAMLSMMMAMGRDGLVSAPAQAGQAPLDVNADTVMNKTSRPPPKKVKKKAAKGDWTANIEG